MSPKKLRGIKREQRRERVQQRNEFQNEQAMREAQGRKTWNTKEIDWVRPRTERQAEVIRSYMEGSDVALLGTAGTGKTFTALFCAARSAFDMASEQDRIVIIRSTAQGREQGFLPGTEQEKYAPFERPYKENLGDLFKRERTYDDMKAAGRVEFESTSFLRGTTIKNAVIVVDEAQNMTFKELNTVLTRVGEGSRLILIGDVKQNDLSGRAGDVSGLGHVMNILKDMRDLEATYFTRADIVRSGFVKSWICAVEDYEAANDLNLIAA